MDILQFIVLIIISYIISSAVHELGHIFTGLFQGFKFYLFIIGPFGFKRNENDKIIFYIEKDISLWGGVGAVIPVMDDLNNFKKFERVILGGPAASLIFGIISLPFGLITQNLLLLLLGAMPISMGIICLIPFRTGAFYSDGGKIFRMHKDENTKAVEKAIWNITQNAIINGNYSKVEFNEIIILITDKEIRTKYLGHYYAYCFYKDSKDFLNIEKEKAELYKLKKEVPKQMISMFPID